MHTHRFGKKIKLPSTIAIKHQLRKLMFDDLVKRAEKAEKAEVIARAEQFAIIERNKSTLATGAPAASVIVGLKARSRPCVTAPCAPRDAFRTRLRSP